MNKEFVSLRPQTAKAQNELSKLGGVNKVFLVSSSSIGLKSKSQRRNRFKTIMISPKLGSDMSNMKSSE